MDMVEIYTSGTMSCLERLLHMYLQTVAEINEALHKISHVIVNICIFIYLCISGMG